MNSKDQISLFYSYAHEDEKHLDKLKTHLRLLQRQGLINVWYDRDISAGTEWEREIDEHLNSAQIILLLISPDFMDSDYCYSKEMLRAMERHKQGEVRVIPILLRPVLWEDAPFAKLQVLPKNGKAVINWKNQDLAYTEIATAIRAIVKRSKNEFSGPQTYSVTSKHQQREEPVPRRRIPKAISEELKDLSHYLQKVSELKSVHNKLHEIEELMEGLTATILSPLLIDKSKEKKLSFRWPFIMKEINQFPGIIVAVEKFWEQVQEKINDLVYFAAEEMDSLGERLSFNSSGVRGPSWMTELLAAQSAFEASMEDRNAEEMDKRAQELLRKCREHLRQIDRQLLSAVKEVDSALRSIQ